MYDHSHLLCLLVLGFCLCSCVSSVTYQTARVLKKGSVDYVIGLGRQSVSYRDLDDPNRQLKENIKGSGYPFVETGFRYGLARQMDVGIKYTFKNQISVDGKYALFDDGVSRYASASGLGLSLGRYAFKIRHDTQTLSFVDVWLPWYHSMDLNAETTIMFNVSVLRRWVDIAKTDGRRKENFNFLGVSFGLSYRWLLMAVSLDYEMTSRRKFFKNFVIGYRYGWSHVKKPTF